MSDIYAQPTHQESILEKKLNLLPQKLELKNVPLHIYKFEYLHP